LLSALEVENMTGMKPLKASAACAGAAVLSLFWVFLRGDLMCASEFTGRLGISFLAFGFAAVILLVVGIVQSTRRTFRNEPKSAASPPELERKTDVL
jgi:hypothetical protein